MTQLTITAILALSNKKMNPSIKLKNIKAIVKNAKESYGNTGKKISLGKVNTCNGQQSIKYLADEDKLGLVEVEVESIRLQAINVTECTQGIVFDKKVTELIACSPILSNLGKSVTSTFL